MMRIRFSLIALLTVAQAAVRAQSLPSPLNDPGRPAGNVPSPVIVGAARKSASGMRDASAPAQPGSPGYFQTGVLTLNDRIWAQTQIERVYYNHRIWPKENAQPKPPFEVMVPAAVIRAKVEDSLKKSAALEHFWGAPVTEAMLQTEIERMARESRDPATLKELFAALHEDPFLIADTLAREALADRRIRQQFSGDPRIHAGARALAERIHAEAARRDWRHLEGEYHRVTFVRAANDEGSEPRHDPARIELGAEAFTARKSRMAAAGSVPPLQETADGFFLSRLVSEGPGEYTVETLAVAKRGFLDWWSEVADQSGADFTRPVSRTPGPDRTAVTKLPLAPAALGCDLWDDPGKLETDLDSRAYHTAVWTGTEMIIWGGYYNDGTTPTDYNSGGRYNPATDTWLPTSTGTNLPVGRFYHSAVWTGSVMIVWGGYSNGVWLNTGGRYNPSGDSWLPTSTGANVPAARDLHSAVWTGSAMIVWGGYDSFNLVNTGGRYNPAGDSWLATSIGANVPLARYGHSAVWTGSVMIVWGGEVISGTPMNSGGRYNPAGDSWLPTSLGANLPSARWGSTAVWTGTEMLVWGGGGSGSTVFNTGGRYNPAGDSWLSINTTGAPLARVSHTAVWTGSVMVVWGGLDGSSTYYSTGGRYNPVGDSWTATSITGAAAPLRRAYHSAVWTGSEMIVWGGYSFTSQANYHHTGGRYDPTGDTWASVNYGANVPAPRANHSAVWTGAEMIIWGGFNNETIALNTGGRYNPATATWQFTTTGANVPSARAQFSMVWTGSEVIIWGGTIAGASTYYNTGGRYNPAGDSWLATSTGTNVPSARAYHSAVWTGSELIVWGGSDFSNIVNTGGRYNPAGDTWLPTSTGANVPAVRSGQTAVWTGSEMIVWGGSSYLVPASTNTGGRYNPGSDTWLPTSVGANVPPGRRFHTAVWTGTEMIVWGGYVSPAYLNTGGRYNPSSDSWLATSTGANTPSGRYQHSAVWTGAPANTMIVWGGFDGNVSGTALNTGSRYNPAGDSWLPTSTSSLNVAVGRWDHSAVWAGGSVNAMIVWGGSNTGGYRINTGGIYAIDPPGSPGASLRGTKTAFVNFFWNSASGAAVSYNVKRCAYTTTPCIPATIIATVGSTAYSEALDANKYNYAVEAVNACGATP